MAYLARALKDELSALCTELGIPLGPKALVKDIKKLIIEDPNYDEEFTKALLERIKEEKKLELEEKKRREDLEEKKRIEQMELEERKRKQEMEFELEKLRIQAQSSLSTGISPSIETSHQKLDILHLMQKFDSKTNEISLFLILFERQVNRIEPNKNLWVSHLIPLLPQEITQIIAREPEEIASDYGKIKELLLKKYKMTPEKFRQLFYKHGKGAENTWADFAYEVKNYFNEWISGLQVHTFEELTDLMVTDQIKRKVPFEVKEHFIDDWSKIIKSEELVTKLENYESVRADIKRKPVPTSYKEKNWPSKNTNENFDNERKKENYKEKRWENSENYVFERSRRLQCFECGSYDHLRPQCPQIKKKDYNNGTVNRVIVKAEEKLLSKYMSEGIVNGVQMSILRDTGATVDIICKKYVSPYQYTGEYMWIKHPFDNNPIRLPLAKVKLEGEFGRTTTLAAVVRNELDRGHYVLGNGTVNKIEKFKEMNSSQTNTNKVDCIEKPIENKQQISKKVNEDELRDDINHSQKPKEIKQDLKKSEQLNEENSFFDKDEKFMSENNNSKTKKKKRQRKLNEIHENKPQNLYQETEEKEIEKSNENNTEEKTNQTKKQEDVKIESTPEIKIELKTRRYGTKFKKKVPYDKNTKFLRIWLNGDKNFIWEGPVKFKQK